MWKELFKEEVEEIQELFSQLREFHRLRMERLDEEGDFRWIAADCGTFLRSICVIVEDVVDGEIEIDELGRIVEDWKRFRQGLEGRVVPSCMDKAIGILERLYEKLKSASAN